MASESLVTKLNIDVAATYKNVLDLGSNPENTSLSAAIVIADGSGTSQADTVWSDSRDYTVGHTNFDLNAMLQLNTDGDTVRTLNFANLKLVAIRSKESAGGSGYAEIGGGTDGGAAADAWAGITTMFKVDAAITSVYPGGLLVWYNPTGGTVTGTSADIFHIEAVTANQELDIMLIGDHV